MFRKLMPLKGSVMSRQRILKYELESKQAEYIWEEYERKHSQTGLYEYPTQSLFATHIKKEMEKGTASLRRTFGVPSRLSIVLSNEADDEQAHNKSANVKQRNHNSRVEQRFQNGNSLNDI